MNTKQEKFVEYYLINGNASESYEKAYPGVKRTSAAANGEKLLRKAEIIAAIDKGREALKAKCLVTKEELIQDLLDIKALHKEGDARGSATAIKAIELITKMLGLQAPAQSEITVKGEQELFGPIDDKGILND